MPARDVAGRYSRLKGKGAFAANVDALAARVRGTWTGKVEVNQVYAHYQHEHPEFHHPDGGEAFYLQRPLYSRYRRYYGILARHAITGEGTDLREGFRQVVEDLSLQVYHHAPWEFGDLRASGHPSVTRDGMKIYDRKPLVHRLSERELKDKAHLRYLFDPNRYGQR